MTVGSPGNVVSRDITPSAQKRTAAQPPQLTAAPGKCPFTPYQASSADGCQKNIEGAFRPDKFNKRGEYLMVWGTGLLWEKAVWQTCL